MSQFWTSVPKCQRWKSFETPAKSSHLRASCSAERRSAFSVHLKVCKSLLNLVCVKTRLGVTNILFIEFLSKYINKLMNFLPCFFFYCQQSVSPPEPSTCSCFLNFELIKVVVHDNKKHYCPSLFIFFNCFIVPFLKMDRPSSILHARLKSQ